jgi:hypothetical protein
MYENYYISIYWVKIQGRKSISESNIQCLKMFTVQILYTYAVVATRKMNMTSPSHTWIRRGKGLLNGPMKSKVN